MGKPFQRIDSESNAQVGREFEIRAQSYFASRGIQLRLNLPVAVGIGNREKKFHSFDLGCNEKKILVECKSHKWTAGNNVPSAKMTLWNEAMYYFHAAPTDYKKILFVLRDCSKAGKSLASYYLETYKHLIPPDVEILEFDEKQQAVIKVI